MWRKVIAKIKKHLTPHSMTKKQGQIEVHATKEGKLYIRPADLFNQKSVQTLIQKVVKSEALKQVHKGG